MICLCIVAITGLIAMNMKNKELLNPTDENVVASLNHSNLIHLLKDNVETTKEDLLYWLVTETIFLGKKDAIEVYEIKGTYSCKDNSNCFSLGKENKFHAYVEIEKEQIKNILPEYEIKKGFVEKKEPLKENLNPLEQNILEKAKEGAKELGIDYETIQIQYANTLDNLNIYYVYGDYKEKEDFDSLLDMRKNMNKFHFYLSGKIENDEFQVKGYHQVSYGILRQIHDEKDLKSANEYTEILKKYFEEQNLITEDLKEWKITEVTYLGYYQPENIPLIKFSGNYSCKDGSTDCLYLPQIDSQKEDGMIPFQLIVSTEKDQIKQVYGTVPYIHLVSFDRKIKN